MNWQLQSLTTTDGYLRDCKVPFVSGLNCIIGARGTCKSTIVETLRFAFDCDSEAVRILTGKAKSEGEKVFSRFNLIGETLSGGTVKCNLIETVEPRAKYVVERNIQGPPRLFREDVLEIEPESALRRIEVYSQGDLHTIAENPARRLSLIDRPNQKRIESIRDSQVLVANELREIGQRLRQRGNEIDSRRQKVLGLDAAKQRLDSLVNARPALSQEFEQEREAYEKRRKYYDLLANTVEVRKDVLFKLKSLADELPRFTDAGIAAESVGSEESKQLGQSFRETAATLEGILDIPRMPITDSTRSRSLIHRRLDVEVGGKIEAACSAPFLDSSLFCSIQKFPYTENKTSAPTVA